MNELAAPLKKARIFGVSSPLHPISKGEMTARLEDWAEIGDNLRG